MTEAKKQKRVETLYQVHNTTRSLASRMTRVQAARRDRMNLLLGGGLLRIPRGRYQVVTESTIKRLIPDLLEKERNGSVVVTTMTGLRIDLNTGRATTATTASPPLPHPPLDSAATDESFEHGVGESMATVPGGRAPTEAIKVPEVLQSEIPEGKEEPPALPEVSKEEPMALEQPTLEELSAAIYDSAPAKVLSAKAAELGLSTEGNKRDISARLAEAGYRPE